MKLIAFSIEGYRRFVAKSSVKLHGDIIAFVGPNEAGKSSLLKALTHLNDDRDWEPTELPRRSNVTPELRWHFQLEEREKEAIKDIAEATNVERVVIRKGKQHTRYWSFEPSNPVRSRANRESIARFLAGTAGLYSFSVASEDPNIDFTLEEYSAVIELLDDDHENLDEAQIESISTLARKISAVEFAGVPEDSNLIEDEEEGVFQEARTGLASALNSVAAEESAPSPVRRTIDAVNGFLPQVVYFSDEDRDLASQYDLNEVVPNAPSALNHLAVLADLDLAALAKEAGEGRVADVGTRRNAANRVLLNVFDESWNQQGIAIQFEIQGSILHVQATTPEDSGLSDISERSDGMRWFAALLAYAHGWARRPILLIDEIETHLHYDAQADVVAVLAKQSFTSKVIYTTHSFGCLPYDLGTGVRLVQPIDAATSRLETGFWKSGAGFTPLLVSMGAAAMSFTPTRYALMAEGPSDAILLPSLLRQATGKDQLGFHVAPGISSVAALAVEQLDAEAGRVGFIVDGDEGGIAHTNKLVENGISTDRIIILRDDDGEPLETEDLIDKVIYTTSVMDEIRLWNAIEADIEPSALPERLRTKFVTDWCRANGIAAPDKASVAQRVVDLSSDHDICKTDQIERLKNIAGQVSAILRLP